MPVANISGAKVEFKIGNEIYTWTLPSSTTYEAGKKYSYNITLQEEAGNNTAIVASGSIVDWTDVPSGSYTIGKDEENGGGTTDPVEQTLYTEDFGSTIVSSNTKIAAFTGWSNTAVTYTDQFAVSDIRVLKSGDNLTNHVWLPANKDAELAISNINTEKSSKLKLTFDIAANVFNAGTKFDIKDLSIDLNGQKFSPTSKVLSKENNDANIFYTVEVDLSAATSVPASSKITLTTTATNNTVGVRIDNIVLKGQK